MFQLDNDVGNADTHVDAAAEYITVNYMYLSLKAILFKPILFSLTMRLSIGLTTLRAKLNHFAVQHQIIHKHQLC